jgi:hypothetical protein
VGEAAEPSRSPAPAPPPEAKDASAKGGRALLAPRLSVATRKVVAWTSRIFGELREQGGHAVREFQARPEHARWRAYALGSYGLIAVATLLFQFYDPNPLGAAVRVQRVEIPRSTYLSVRNGSRKPWKGVKLTLNGVYGYSQDFVRSGEVLLVQVDQFMVVDAAGVPSYAPQGLDLRTLHIDCDRGAFDAKDAELKP